MLCAKLSVGGHTKGEDILVLEALDHIAEVHRLNFLRLTTSIQTQRALARADPEDMSTTGVEAEADMALSVLLLSFIRPIEGRLMGDCASICATNKSWYT